MNNVELLLLSINQDPDDLTAVCALTDALIEERDMQRSEADRHAERVVQAVRDARDLAEAARLMRPEQPWHDELVTDIMSACGSPLLSGTIIVVTSDMTPFVSGSLQHGQGRAWFNPTITVGAQWLIRHFRSNPSLYLVAPPAPKKRRHSR